MKIRKLILTIFILAFAVPGWATTYYMRADGTAANKAAASGPCGTVGNTMSIATHDADTFSAGDIINLCDDGGVYRDQMDIPSSGSDGSPITYQAASGDSPVISGADLVSTWTQSTSVEDSDYVLDADYTSAANDMWTRDIVPAGTFTGDGTEIRIQVQANSAQTLTIVGASVGEREGSTDDYDATPSVGGAGVTRITWDTGNNGDTVAAGQTEWSDWVNYTWDQSYSHLVHVNIGDGANSYTIRDLGAPGDAYRDFSVGDETMVEVVSGDSVATEWYTVLSIEIRSSLTNVYEATLATEPNQVYFDDTYGTNEAGACPGALNVDQEWCYSTKLYQHSTSDPDTRYTSPGTEASIRDNNIDIAGKDYITFTGAITFERADDAGIEVTGSSSDLIFTGVASQAMKVLEHKNYGIKITGADAADRAKDILIEHVEFVDIGDWNDSLPGDIVFAANTSENTVQDCILRGDSSTRGVDGITFNGGQGAGYVIQRNTSYGHWENAFDFKQHWINDAEVRTIVQYNEIYGEGGNDEAGIVIHRGSQDIDIRYNIIRDNGKEGISIFNHDDGGAFDGNEADIYIYYNLIYGNEHCGIRDSGKTDGTSNTAGGHRIYGNTIALNGVTDGFYGLDMNSPNNDIRNNIFYKNNSYQIRHNNIAFQTGLTLDYNVLLDSAGGSGNDLYYWGGAGQTLAEMIAATTHCDNSSEADAVMVDPANDDFTLQSNSPAIDAGVIISGYGTKLRVDASWPSSVTTCPIGNNNDIGAYEYPIWGGGP